jgi:hypothetical protein
LRPRRRQRLPGGRRPETARNLQGIPQYRYTGSGPSARGGREEEATFVGDLSFGDDGLKITFRPSKTDQEGLGRKVGISYGGRPRTCPVPAGRDWLDLSLLGEGPLFRHGLVAPKPPPYGPA